MTRWNRRYALGTAMALCQAPTLAIAPAEPSREAQTRRAIDAYARAWASADVAALLACYHPEFTLNYFGQNALSGRHAGKAACLKVLAAMRARTGRTLVAITSTMVGGDQATMVTRETMNARGRTVEMERLYLYRTAGDQLLECWVYDQDQRLVDELIGA